MATNFVPLKAEAKHEEFYKILMSGKGIKKDNGGHDYYDVIPRHFIKGSIGTVGSSDYKMVSAADDVLNDVVKTLKKEGYIVQKKTCSEIYTGRFKAVIYYLAGE